MTGKHGKKIRLLGVDPSPSLRAVLGQLGEDCQMHVDLCASLADARRLLSVGIYELVISAAELPDGTHLDVLSCVREQSQMALTPVVLLAAGRGENVVHEALDRGITEVFFKHDIGDMAPYLERFSSGSLLRDSGHGSRRALVVEDDRVQGAYYKALLFRHGFAVDHVPSGEAALWEAGRCRYDFILVDLVLNGTCSGTQFLRRLRSPELASAQAVAIAMSAYSDAARRLEALRAGANAFIPKPIGEQELAALIKGMENRPLPAEVENHQTARDAFELKPCKRCQPCQLTPRESNVCALVTAGYGDKRIAEEMGVSYWTVRTHIAHAFKKCQVSNRVELVRRLQGD
jgi:DNA-binding NarL/FixJ family response regulator